VHRRVAFQQLPSQQTGGRGGGQAEAASIPAETAEVLQQCTAASVYELLPLLPSVSLRQRCIIARESDTVSF